MGGREFVVYNVAVVIVVIITIIIIIIVTIIIIIITLMMIINYNYCCYNINTRASAFAYLLLVHAVMNFGGHTEESNVGGRG